MDDDWGGSSGADDWGDDTAGAGGDDDEEWEEDGSAPKPKKSATSATAASSVVAKKKTSEDDDGGWGSAEFDDDDENGGGGGGGGDDEFEDDGDGNGDNSSELTTDVLIANYFYEAEDLLRDQPKVALSKFQQVVELAKTHLDSINDESRTAMFNSLVHITTLQYSLHSLSDMIATYEYLLTFIPKVTRNEGAEAIDSVLNTVGTSRDFSFLQQVYTITSTTLSRIPETERMLFNVNMKLCKTYVDKEDYTSALKVLQQLHSTCKTAEGVDDKKNKGSELLEIYALEIKISTSTHDSLKQKELYEATKDLSAAVKDPRSQSVIRECWGQMFGDEGSWARAYTEFYQAFTHYQEIGARDRAKQCLKYVVVANMLCGGSQNPFDAREAKVYQNESDIQAIVGMRAAYEKCDVTAFNAALNDINQNNDPFIRKHLDSMIRDFQGKALQQLVKPYRRIRLNYLSQRLAVKVSVVESILVSLILDGEISGRIDQVNGLLDLTQRQVGGAKKYAAIDAWTGTLQHLTSAVAQPMLPYFQ